MEVGHRLFSFSDHCFWNLHQEWKDVCELIEVCQKTRERGRPNVRFKLAVQ